MPRLNYASLIKKTLCSSFTLKIIQDHKLEFDKTTDVVFDIFMD